MLLRSWAESWCTNGHVFGHALMSRGIGHGLRRGLGCLDVEQGLSKTGLEQLDLGLDVNQDMKWEL